MNLKEHIKIIKTSNLFFIFFPSIFLLYFLSSHFPSNFLRTKHSLRNMVSSLRLVSFSREVENRKLYLLLYYITLFYVIKFCIPLKRQVQKILHFRKWESSGQFDSSGHILGQSNLGTSFQCLVSRFQTIKSTYEDFIKYDGD